MNDQALQQLSRIASAAEQAGDLARAAAAYRELAAAVPRNAELLHRLGLVEYMMGNHDDAIEPLSAAVKLDRRNPGLLVNLGLAQHAAGRHADAVVSLRKAVALKPDLSSAHNNLGLALSALGDHKSAVASATRAVALAPRDAQAHYNLGNAWYAAADFAQAQSAYRRALDLGEARPEVHYNLGNALRAASEPALAIASYRSALALDPNHVPALINLGNLLMGERDYDGAEQVFEQAVALGDHDRRLVEARYNLANFQRMSGRLPAAIDSYRAVLAREPMHEAAYSNLLLTMNYSADVSKAEAFEAHVGYGRRFAPTLAAPAYRVHDLAPGGVGHDDEAHGDEAHAAAAGVPRRLRIGFVSADFRQHAVMLFAWPIIDGLPAHGFDVYCYSNHDRPDAVTEKLRAQVAGWRDIHAIDDAAAAAQIVRDRIDVLVDLTGHTAGHRLRVFAHRPAPVQVTMIGHIGTTGVEAMDYRITDVRAEPADDVKGDGPHHDQWYTEKLIRLPRTCWCMRPAAPAQRSREPAAPDDVFTFGSFNNFAKLSDATLDLWTELLRSMPQSRMLFVTVPEGRTQARLRERFARGGVDPWRIEVHGLVAEARYRALHAQVDVALDPFPCNGFVTTIETLWLGVPVVALEGDSFRSRNGSAILTNAGLGCLAARSTAEYLDIARGLAGDPQRLALARARTGEYLGGTALMDEPAFVAELAAALIGAWQMQRRDHDGTTPNQPESI